MEAKNREYIAKIEKNTAEINTAINKAKESIKKANDWVNLAKQALNMAKDAGNDPKKRSYAQQNSNNLCLDLFKFANSLINQSALAGLTNRLNILNQTGVSADDKKRESQPRREIPVREWKMLYRNLVTHPAVPVFQKMMKQP